MRREGVSAVKPQKKEGIIKMKMKIFFCLIMLTLTATAAAGEGCGVDEKGALRQPGESWQEDCNRCRCLASGVPACTRRICRDLDRNLEPELKLTLKLICNQKEK